MFMITGSLATLAIARVKSALAVGLSTLRVAALVDNPGVRLEGVWCW